MFLTLGEMITSLGQSPDLASDLDDVLTDALAKAQTRLETELDTRLNKLSCVDTFYVDPDLFAGVVSEKLFKLRLRNSFVSSTPVLSLAVCETFNGTFTTVDPSMYRVLPERGIVLLDESYGDASTGWGNFWSERQWRWSAPTTRRAQYVQVTYTSGFVDDQDCLPAIKQALMTLIPLVVKENQPQDPKSNLVRAGFNTADPIQPFITPFNRVVGFGYRPAFYTEAAAA